MYVKIHVLFLIKALNDKLSPQLSKLLFYANYWMTGKYLAVYVAQKLRQF